MANHSKASLEQIVEVCDELFARDGFVKWADVARALGMSRQAIPFRLQAAVEKGQLSPERVAQWQSLTSRAAATRERQKRALEHKREQESLVLRLRLTDENMAWLRKETVMRGVTSADIVNGLITKARL